MQAIGTVANPDAIFGTNQVYCLQALSQSMIVEELEVSTVVARRVDYDDLVDQGLALHESDIARFDCPDLDDPRMLFGSAEYFRWYFIDGQKRAAPLDYDELVALFCYREKCSADEAEHEVSLNSRARVGDKAMWEKVVKFGYLPYVREFASEEYSVF